MTFYDLVTTELSYDPSTGIFTRKKSCKGCRKDSIVGSKTKHGYLVTSFHRKQIYLHRLAWFFVYKEMPNGLVDHIDGDKTNNKINNLRIVNFSENAQNSFRHFDNKSGYKGVWKHSDKKWRSGICLNGKMKYLGLFDNPKDAHNAYVKESQILHSHRKN